VGDWVDLISGIGWLDVSVDRSIKSVGGSGLADARRSWAGVGGWVVGGSIDQLGGLGRGLFRSTIDAWHLMQPLAVPAGPRSTACLRPRHCSMPDTNKHKRRPRARQ
jgi:hypothetical protein